MRYIIVLKCQRRDQQRLGPLLHTSETETNGALQGVQEENSREGSCNLGVLWLCAPPLNCVLPLNRMGEGCISTTSDALIPTRTGLRDVLTFEVVVSRPRHSHSWTQSEFPQTACQRLARKKEDQFVVQMSLLSRDFSYMTVSLYFPFTCRFWDILSPFSNTAYGIHMVYTYCTLHAMKWVFKFEHVSNQLK